jgi:hypothetical protein
MRKKLFGLFFLSLILLGSSQFALAQVNYINDGGFELGISNPQWNAFSTNYGTPLCDFLSCGTAYGVALPRTGNVFAWFGGAGSDLEIGSLDQTITIPSGARELHFWFKNPTSSGSGNDYLQVQIDDNVIATFIEGDPTYTNYTEVVLNIGAYADGGSHKVEFYSVCYGTGNTNFIVDDVSIVMSVVPVSLLTILAVFLILGLVVVYRYTKTKSLILKS